MGLSQIELAWAAGFFDGEGNTYILKGKNKHNKEYRGVKVQVRNTNLEALERFKKAVGDIGTLHGPYQQKANTEYKEFWSFAAASFESAQAVISMLWKFLSTEKKEQYSACIRAVRSFNTSRGIIHRSAVCGTYSKYGSGCRCEPCKDAASVYKKEYFENKQRKEVLAFMEANNLVCNLIPLDN